VLRNFIGPHTKGAGRAIIAVGMTETDLKKVASPRDLGQFSNPELLELLGMNPERTISDWIRDDLQRRLLVSITEETRQLTVATNNVRQEVATLATSSIKLEDLTSKLKTLTIWLMVFAVIQIAIAAVQTWKMSQPERPVEVVPPPPPHSAPQTPSRPPR
jgi:hypothetical protein